MLKESNGNELDTARLKDEWRTKLLTEWQPIDKKRKRGRQLTRWAADLARVAGTELPDKEWPGSENKNKVNYTYFLKNV